MQKQRYRFLQTVFMQQSEQFPRKDTVIDDHTRRSFDREVWLLLLAAIGEEEYIQTR